MIHQAVKPKALQKGDTVAIVAPSGVVREASLNKGVKLLESLGLKVKVGRSVMNRWGYLAGRDEDRAKDLMDAWRDPDVKAVIAARGGYGAMRILPLLDYECIREQPKILLGYSDITALHLAFWKEAGLVTFHGPVAEIWSDAMDPYNLEALKQAIFGNWPPGFLTMPESYCDEGTESKESTRRRPIVLGKGVAEGPLIGGNLSLVVSSLGTPWEIDTKGKILFLEEVSERPYRVDRMLCQLRLAGKLDDANGFCLGDFTDCDVETEPSRPTFSVAQVLEQYFAGMGKPCIANIPSGHGKKNCVLPLGINVRVETLQGLELEQADANLYFTEKSTS